MATKHTTAINQEIFVFISILLMYFLVLIRLFYWQIIKENSLKIEAKQQSQKVIKKEGSRGKIFTSDNYLLVGNKQSYQLIVDKTKLSIAQQDLIDKIKTPLLQEYFPYQQNQNQGEKNQIEEIFTQQLIEKLQREANWIVLNNKISPESKKQIEAFQIAGLNFDAYEDRYYPEASLAAQITGFVGFNEEGERIGYFGIEGALDKELQAQSKKSIFNTDALGSLLANQKIDQENYDGRDIYLTIQRNLQFIAEQELQQGILKYQAKAGEIIIAEPKTGKILALATLPNYSQENYNFYQTNDFKNPALTNIYEPGSTFKIITVATGIETKVITPNTICNQCSGPRQIGAYTIRTWNDEYHPNINMTDALAKSDNVAMIFVAERIGPDRFLNFLKKFQIGGASDLDLQEDTNRSLPEKLRPVELATASFGQGIATTSLQLIRAVSAIANQGKMMKLYIVDHVFDHQLNQELITEPVLIEEIVSPETADQVTKIMIQAANYGEAQWTASQEHLIAGKTGTSQVPIEGGYAEDKTIATFIGFAPPADPKFIMLVKLVEPASSPWAAETAAPLWYKVAEKVFLYLNIPADR